MILVASNVFLASQFQQLLIEQPNEHNRFARAPFINSALK